MSVKVFPLCITIRILGLSVQRPGALCGYAFRACWKIRPETGIQEFSGTSEKRISIEDFTEFIGGITFAKSDSDTRIEKHSLQ